MEQEPRELTEEDIWTLYFDGRMSLQEYLGWWHEHAAQAQNEQLPGKPTNEIEPDRAKTA